MIVEQNCHLKTTVVSPTTLHITLAVAHLKSTEEVAVLVVYNIMNLFQLISSKKF